MLSTLTGPIRVRPLLVLAAVVFASLGHAPPALTRGDTPESCLETTRQIFLYASEMEPTEEGDIRIGYGFTPDAPTIPGPTLEMIEGECISITLTNNVSEATLATLRDEMVALGLASASHPLGISLHVHGVKYTQSSDGTLETDSFVPPGSARTYTWYAAPRIPSAARVTSQGTAGYWWYHDHMVGTSHGSRGAASGLFGALIVRRPGDVLPDRTYVVGMGPNATLNLQHHPGCDAEPAIELASNNCFVARQGELVEFAVIAFGDDFHTFHLHGHTWADNRTGIIASLFDETRAIDNRTVGPADTFGFIIRAGEEVGAGHWMLHCHVQTHSDRGMTTFLHVLDAGGAPLPPAPSHNH